MRLSLRSCTIWDETRSPKISCHCWQSKYEKRKEKNWYFMMICGILSVPKHQLTIMTTCGCNLLSIITSFLFYWIHECKEVLNIQCSAIDQFNAIWLPVYDPLITRLMNPQTGRWPPSCHPFLRACQQGDCPLCK